MQLRMLVITIALAGLACGTTPLASDSGISDGGTADGGPGDGGDGGTADGGQAWPSEASGLEASASPGFGANFCGAGFASTYSVTFDGGAMSYSVCDTVKAKVVTGSKVLAASELAGLQAALEGLTVTTRAVCGADKGVLFLIAHTPGGNARFDDSFYSCLPRQGSVYVDNIDEVFARLSAFVP